jgi:hypothetical protein
MKLEPRDPHDEVLAQLERRRSVRDRRRRDQQIEAWRSARPVAAAQ